MFQQIIALIIIFFFLSRLFWQKNKKQINATEFIFWFCFWVLAAIAIIFIKQIDVLTKDLGFSSPGINILLYISVLVLFYLIFRLRLKIAKMEQNITRLVREIAIKEKE